jgi:DNA-binding MurR/RpiR family transcriptional regulator
MEPAARLLESRAGNVDGDRNGPFGADEANFNDLIGSFNQSQADAVVDLLCTSSQVFTAGTRSSESLAISARFLLMQIRDGVSRLRADEPEGLDTVQSEDVILAFTFPRYNRVVHNICKQATDLGATLIVIAESELAPLAEEAEHVLLAPCWSNSFFNSNATAVILLNLLVARVADRLGTQAVEKLERNARRGQEIKLHA